MATRRLPYPGLRSFGREETDLFFGREGCVDDMVDRLARRRFLAVLGASGSGKSSLVRTGLLDALDLGLLNEAGSYWLIADFRPGSRPLYNLAEGLIRATGREPEDDDEIELLRAFLARGPRSVVEWCKAGNLPEGANLLLLADQFEELFRYSNYSGREEAEAFVSVLLESKAALEEAQIYVTITMRSEFLGAAALINGLAEAINDGLYLTPRMTRDQVREAIVGPAGVCGFKIEPALVNRLLNDLTAFAPWEEGDAGDQLERLVRRSDQLPLMQHVLNRLWSLAEEPADGGTVELKLADYQRVGGLKGALDAHGREILVEIGEECRDQVASVFRGLTAGTSLTDAVRRPAPLKELVAIAGGDEAKVRAIIEKFRQDGRNFLTPSQDRPLEDNTVIDISHESLIRQWGEFAEWLKAEANAVSFWRRLVDASEQYDRKQAGRLVGLQLANMLAWREADRPSPAWAARYGGDFAKAMAFLDASRDAEEAERRRLEEERRREARRRYVRLVQVFAAVLIPAVIIGVVATIQWIRADQSAAEAARQTTAAQTASNEAQQARTEAEARAREAATARDEAQRQEQAARDSQVEAEAAANQLRLSSLSVEVAEFQRVGEWEGAGDLLGEFWDKLTASGANLAAAATALPAKLKLGFVRERAAVLSSSLDFADYAGLREVGIDSNASNRFRIFETVDTGAGVGDVTYTVIIFDALVGAAIGRFALPEGREAVLEGGGFVSSDGAYAAVATKDRMVALWSRDSAEVVMRPIWDADGGGPLVTKFQLAPVVANGRYVMLVEGETESTLRREFIVLDRTDPAVRFSIPWSKVESDAGYSEGTIDADQIHPLGVSGNTLLIFTSTTIGDLESVDMETSKVSLIRGDSHVHGARLSPDGRLMLLVVGHWDQKDKDNPYPCADTGSEYCVAALSMPEEKELWVTATAQGDSMAIEPLQPVGSGQGRYRTMVGPAGGPFTVLEFPRNGGTRPTVRNGETETFLGDSGLDGSGQEVKLGELGTQDPPSAVARIYRYAIADGRWSNALYVEGASVATFSRGATVRVAGVTYGNKDAQEPSQIQVYRRNASGGYEPDPTFPTEAIDRACVRAIAFGGGGDGLLVIRKDNYILSVRADEGGGFGAWYKLVPAGEQAASSPRTPSGASERASTATEAESSVLRPVATPPDPTNCPEASQVFTRIVPVDLGDSDFGIVDDKKNLWWLRIDPTPGRAGGVAEIGLARRGVSGVAADPNAGLIATMVGARVTIRPASAEAIFATPLPSAATDVAPSANDMASQVAQPAAASPQVGGASTVGTTFNVTGLPKALVFLSSGRLAVVSYDRIDQVQWYGRHGAHTVANAMDWQLLGRAALPEVADSTVQATPDEGLLFFDPATYEATMVAFGGDLSDDPVFGGPQPALIVGQAMLPNGPVTVMPLGRNRVLGVEYDTDDIAEATARVPLQFNETAALVTMRSRLESGRLDQETLDASAIGTNAAEPLAAAACAGLEMKALSLLDALLINGDRNARDAFAKVISTAQARCADTGRSDVYGQLAELADDGDDPVTRTITGKPMAAALHAAVAGDGVGLHAAGTVMVLAVAHGDPAGLTAAGVEAARFGSGAPAEVLQAIAAGASLDADLIARLHDQADSADPTVHQLLAGSDERQIGDVDAASDSLLHYTLAEKLYRASGRLQEALFAGYRRAALSRVLPDAAVLTVWRKVAGWQPAPLQTAAWEEPPADPVERIRQELADIEKLSVRVPDSRLLASLRTELTVELSRVLAPTDAAAAASEGQAAAELLSSYVDDFGWSAWAAARQLDVADLLKDGNPGAAAGIVLDVLIGIDRAFRDPVSRNDVVDLFENASGRFSAVAAAAPSDRLRAAAREIDLAMLDYRTDTFPFAAGAGQTRAGRLLAAAMRLSQDLAPYADDKLRWARLRTGLAFWMGVIGDDSSAFDQAAAALRQMQVGDRQDPAAELAFADLMRGFVDRLPGTSANFAARGGALNAALVAYRALLAIPAADRTGIDNDALTSAYDDLLQRAALNLREQKADDAAPLTVADHAAWVLSALALAQEYETLHFGDANQLTNRATWLSLADQPIYARMIAYPIGFLSGRVRMAAQGTETATECDAVAADRFDSQRVARGVASTDVNPSTAATDCEAALLESDAPRLSYQYGRALMLQGDKSQDAALRRLLDAAELDLPIAYDALGDHIADATPADAGPLFKAFLQRMIASTFVDVFPTLRAAATADQQSELLWYAQKAADLGVPEAHLVLGELETTGIRQRTHYLIAARLLEDRGDADGAAAASAKAAAVPVSPDQAAAAQSTAAGWAPIAWENLPADLS